MVGRGLDVLRYPRLSIAVRCRAAISVSSCLTSRGGSEPVMRDPTLIFAADELLSFLAQAGQSGAHAVPLPTSGLGQVADRRASWPLQQSEDRGLLRWTGRRGRHACLAASLLACSGRNRVVLADIPRCRRFSADFGCLLPSELTAGGRARLWHDLNLPCVPAPAGAGTPPNPPRDAGEGCGYPGVRNGAAVPMHARMRAEDPLSVRRSL